eukprot:m.8961 g.8961  ORF g.8961 m.8961 type:complete len:108 (+) comp11529_c0_seq1:298-621(+)
MARTSINVARMVAALSIWRRKLALCTRSTCLHFEVLISTRQPRFVETEVSSRLCSGAQSSFFVVLHRPSNQILSSPEILSSTSHFSFHQHANRLIFSSCDHRYFIAG